MALNVTDHALLRWLERTGIADFTEVRALLAASLERGAQAAGSLGVSRYLILADGMVFVVNDGNVITAIVDDGRHHGHMLAPGRDLA